MSDNENIENEGFAGLEPGKVYFMREVDLLTGVEYPYYKIGKVLNDKDVARRLKEHQTGNPRGIQIVEEIQSQMVTRLETTLHNLNASNRVHSGEWFHFADWAALTAVITEAKALNADIDAKAAAVTAASANAVQVSNGDTLAATDELTELAALLAGYNGAIKILSGHANNVKHAISELPQDELWAKIARYSTPIASAKFNVTAFKKAHPSVYEEFSTKPKLAASFRLDTKLAAAPVSVDLGQSHDLEWLASLSIEELHAEYLRLWAERARMEWQATDFKALLSQAIGENDAIDGLLTWKRTNGFAFDPAALKDARPELHSEFTLPNNPKPSLKVFEWKSY